MGRWFPCSGSPPDAWQPLHIGSPHFSACHCTILDHHGRVIISKMVRQNPDFFPPPAGGRTLGSHNLPVFLSLNRKTPSPDPPIRLRDARRGKTIPISPSEQIAQQRTGTSRNSYTGHGSHGPYLEKLSRESSLSRLHFSQVVPVGQTDQVDPQMFRTYIQKVVHLTTVTPGTTTLAPRRLLVIDVAPKNLPLSTQGGGGGRKSWMTRTASELSRTLKRALADPIGFHGVRICAFRWLCWLRGPSEAIRSSSSGILMSRNA